LTVKLLYFAWVRERVGLAEEHVELPGDVATVADLICWLKRRGPGYEAAFERAETVRAAVDRVHVRRRDAPVTGAREIAFFPPVTGG
jgi:molybdopterin synthase sulfur carrier subunit